MNLLVPLAGLLGIEISAVTERVRNAVIRNALIVLFGLIGMIFLTIAGFLALAGQLGAIYAALIFGGAGLVLALAVYLGSLVGRDRYKRALIEKRRSSETSAFMTTAAITALPMLLQSPLFRTLGLPAAALAAFLLVRGGSDRSDD